jgi:hypothetical protein
MNNKVRYNTYSKNVFKPYQPYQINTVNSSNCTCNYNKRNNTTNQNESPFLLTGGDASGSVWINQSYNVAEESPGISWVL